MSEHQATLAHSATAHAAGAVRPRVSADSFRNLTARLKKSDLHIPTLMPVLASVPDVTEATIVPPTIEVLATPEIVSEAPPEKVAAPASVDDTFTAQGFDDNVSDLAEVEAKLEIEPAQPVIAEYVAPTEIVEVLAVEPQELLPIDPIVDAAIVPVDLTPLEQVVETADEPAVELLAGVAPVSAVLPEPAVEAQLQEEFAHVALEPVVTPGEEIVPLPVEVASVAPIELMPIEVVSVELASANAIPDELKLADVAPVDVVPMELETIAVAPVEIAAVEVSDVDLQVVDTNVALTQRFPDLPEFVPNPVPVVARESSEPALKGSFADNFTYVPEPGKEDAPKLDLADMSEAIKQEVSQRATELALENNWRLLLAKPTAEDRSTYLREAGEYHAADDEWNKPAPEHDLSQIEPDTTIDFKTDVEPLIVDTLSIAPIERSLVESLPVASGQDLSELSRSLLDMMAAGNTSGLPQERALAADTLLRIVPRLELKAVMLLAQRLAMMDNPPHLLVTRLIRDARVQVAGPLLEDCAHIPDKDLESVVQEGEPEKLRLIARRRKLSRAISDVLIKSGDPSVVLTLVRNAEAEISHDGFESLLVLCQNQPDLLAPLATRHDLSAPMAFEMFWLAPAQLRRFILSRFLTDSETLTKILKITLATNLGEEGEAEPLSQHAMLEALERAARGLTEVASEELANLLQVSAATVARILSDLAGDPMIIMLKAAGYPRSAVSGLLKRMQDADLPLISRERDVSELQAMFETLSFNKARILLTYWDWAQKKLGPYAPVQ